MTAVGNKWGPSAVEQQGESLGQRGEVQGVGKTPCVTQQPTGRAGWSPGCPFSDPTHANAKEAGDGGLRACALDPRAGVPSACPHWAVW